jgi:aryl-alcohol dehydrogenase-like predicted oxidoreductase
MAQFALRWILMFEAVSCVIPGAKRISQAEDNANAADLPPIPDEVMMQVGDIYGRMIKEHVHQLW